jgi:fructose-1,6-bisphosphatase/inositol monophosphatase family enzyme
MVSSSSPDFFAPAEWQRYRALRQEVSWAVFGGSCYAYMQLASGRIDLSLDCSMDVFDILPLMPIIEGAGGLVTDWAGKPLDLSWKGSVLAAGDPALHTQALRILGG